MPTVSKLPARVVTLLLASCQGFDVTLGFGKASRATRAIRTSQVRLATRWPDHAVVKKGPRTG